MLATYASVLVVCGASLAIGQAALACAAGGAVVARAGGRMALVWRSCWGTVRLPGEGPSRRSPSLRSPLASAPLPGGAGRGWRRALRAGAPVAVAALLAASLPFIVEGRLRHPRDSFNPDMSQHLLAADRLADGAASPLLAQGYPLGPHAVVVALEQGLGDGLVQGFGGLTLAVAVLAALTALGALRDAPAAPPHRRRPARRPALHGRLLPRPGAFKETIQALFVLAFALGLLSLRELRRGRAQRRCGRCRWR